MLCISHCDWVNAISRQLWLSESMLSIFHQQWLLESMLFSVNIDYCLSRWFLLSANDCLSQWFLFSTNSDCLNEFCLFPAKSDSLSAVYFLVSSGCLYQGYLYSTTVTESMLFLANIWLSVSILSIFSQQWSSWVMYYFPLKGLSEPMLFNF